MHERFDHAVWRLTAWYTLVLFLLSLTFSSIVYMLATSELHQTINAPLQSHTNIFVDSDAARSYRQQRLEQSASHLFGSLGLFTLTIVGLGGVASFFFARRTLQPIADAAESQSRFSSDAAHELKTPLTVMQTEIEVALRNAASPKSLYRKTLESNLEEVARLRALTDRLLLLARNNTLLLEPTAITDIVNEALHRAQGRAKARSITLVSDITDAHVMAHGESLTDAVVIVLDNAIKYSPTHSTVTITSTARGSNYELHITDQGEGIAERDQPYIFDRFYRADQSRTNSHINGTGLGLPLARKLMTLQSGRINLATSSANGTTFSLAIPVAKKSSH